MIDVMENFVITVGKGVANHPLVAFDSALLHAGIGNYNLVRVSSILPPNCSEKEKIDLRSGSLLFTAYSSLVVQKGSATASISVSLPCNNECGLIFEHCLQNIDDNQGSGVVLSMGIDALRARGWGLQSQLSKSITIVASESSKYYAVIAAVAMW